MKTKHKPSDNGSDKSFLEIDEHNLEREWVGQPALYEEWAAKLANARKRFDEAKANLELTEAECDRAVRADPKEFNVEKITENVVRGAVVMQDEYQQAVAEVNEARYAVGVLEAAVTALDHRKKALEKLVDLFLAGYFSEPRANAATKEFAETTTKRVARSKGVR